MSDRVMVSFEFGGKFDGPKIDAFTDLALTMGLALYFEDPKDLSDFRRRLIAQSNKGDPGRITGKLIDLSELEELYDYCVEHRIGFVSNVYSTGDYDGERTLWKPGWKKRKHWFSMASDASEMMVRHDQLLDWEGKGWNLKRILNHLNTYTQRPAEFVYTPHVV